MIRSEVAPEQLTIGYLEQFCRVGEIEQTIRIMWILNSASTLQIDEDELTLRITRAKNKTL